MKYDFDEFVDRRGTAAVKWNALPDGGDDVIPMWVADMDFRVPPCITEALHRRVDTQVFGYVDVGNEYFQAVIDWYKRRHNLTLEREWIQYTTSVIPAVSTALRALTEPGDKVAILTPVYNCFFTTIEHNRCQVQEIPLRYDSDSGRYTIDAKSIIAVLKAQRLGADHLRIGISGAETPADGAERGIRDARHGRQDQLRIHRYGSDQHVGKGPPFAGFGPDPQSDPQKCIHI